MANAKDRPELAMNEILLEGMMAGLLESCQIVQPSELGAKTLEPFEQALRKAANKEIVGAVREAAGTNEMCQEDFLLHFLQLLEKGAGPFQELAAALDAQDSVDAIRRIVRFLGIRFGTLFCLMATRIEQIAAAEKGLLSHRGNLVSIPA